MFKIICGCAPGPEHTAYHLAHEFGFETDGFYIRLENRDFVPTLGDNLIPLEPKTKLEEKVKKNVEMADAVLILRKKFGGNARGVDETIGYCVQEKWVHDFHFRTEKRAYRPCIVTMDCLAPDAEANALENDIKRVITFLKYRRVKKLYITGHPEPRMSYIGAMWREQTTNFLRELFGKIKNELCIEQVPAAIQDVEPAVSSIVSQSSELSFLSQSPIVSTSPFTPSLCETEVVKPLFDESKSEPSEIHMKHDSRRGLLYLQPESLESKIMRSLQEIDSSYSPKRQRID
jgi:hypothetical protein